MIEVGDSGPRDAVPILKKLNPLWWLGGPDGLNAPLYNNGAPYLPGISNQLVRDIFWFFRNPGMNFVGFVLGVEDRHYTIDGSGPQVNQNSGRDLTPQVEGWRWAVLWPTPKWPTFWVMFVWLAVFFVYWPAIIGAFWTLLKLTGPLPYVAYWKRGGIEFYLGWRPSSGGFGTKIVKRAD